MKRWILFILTILPNHSIVNTELDLIAIQEIKIPWVSTAANQRLLKDVWMWMDFPKMLAMLLNPFSAPLSDEESSKDSNSSHGRTVQAIWSNHVPEVGISYMTCPWGYKTLAAQNIVSFHCQMEFWHCKTFPSTGSKVFSLYHLPSCPTAIPKITSKSNPSSL